MAQAKGLMRTALLYQEGNFVGREYFAALVGCDLAPALVVAVGRMKAESIAIEQERTGGAWNPPPIPETDVTHRFPALGDDRLIALLAEERIDVAIQGGIGIIKEPLLSTPRIGWLNVHPGKLPEYRGNACPEWAILSGDPVVATAHLIDQDIDTGPVISEKTYKVSPSWTYFEFRANLYRHCALTLVDALRRLADAGTGAKAVAQPQDASAAHYWPPLGPTERAAVRARFPLAVLPADPS